MTKIILIFMLFLFFGASLCVAAPFIREDNSPMAYVVTGIIELKGRNTIEIRDENDKVLKRFVYFGDDVEIGARVRVRYDPGSLKIVMLKKMTKLEYRDQGQNLGYISYQSKKP